MRWFTEQTIGDYSFAFALAMVLGMVVGLGVRSLVTREVSNDPSLGAAYPLNLLVLHGTLSLFVFAGLFAWAQIAGFSASPTLLCLLAFGSVGLTTAGYGAVAVVDASGQVHRGAQAEFTGKMCTFALGFTALLAGLEIVFIMAAQVAGALCYFGLALRWAGQGRHMGHWPGEWIWRSFCGPPDPPCRLPLRRSSTLSMLCASRYHRAAPDGRCGGGRLLRRCLPKR